MWQELIQLNVNNSESLIVAKEKAPCFAIDFTASCVVHLLASNWYPLAAVQSKMSSILFPSLNQSYSLILPIFRFYKITNFNFNFNFSLFFFSQFLGYIQHTLYNSARKKVEKRQDRNKRKCSLEGGKQSI